MDSTSHTKSGGNEIWVERQPQAQSSTEEPFSDVPTLSRSFGIPEDDLVSLLEENAIEGILLEPDAWIARKSTVRQYLQKTRHASVGSLVARVREFVVAAVKSA